MTTELWTCGPVDLWNCGPVDLWKFGPVDLWTCGPVALWPCELVDLCGLANWLSGPGRASAAANHRWWTIQSSPTESLGLLHYTCKCSFTGQCRVWLSATHSLTVVAFSCSQLLYYWSVTDGECLTERRKTSASTLNLTARHNSSLKQVMPADIYLRIMSTTCGSGNQPT